MENKSARINVEGGEIELENGNELEREEENEKKEDEELSVEKLFENKEVPSWKKQLTMRAFAVSFLLSVMFCFMVMRLSFTIGIVPSFGTSAGLLGFVFIKTGTKVIQKYSGMLGQPFTRQENTVIQTCVVASIGIAFSGGFGSYLFAMSERVVKQSEQGNYSLNYKNPALAWMIGFLFVTSFLGPFIVLALSKITIKDSMLTYPSGTATALMINSFHSSKGAKLAKQHFKVLRQFLSLSFLWSFFQWFFTGGDNCGFSSFPTFGLKAYQNRFYFDFSAVFVGVGMICPCIINVSVLLGGILSWGIMWPLIETRKGNWYSVDLKPSSLQGLQGYKVFVGIAMILGDGLYNFLKVLCQMVAGLSVKLQERRTNMQIPVTERSSLSKSLNYDDQCRTQVFLKEQIPTRFAIGGYIAIAAASTITLPHFFRQLNWYYMIVEPATLPHIFHQLKWYYIIVIYIFAPILAFSNAFGCGQTDWSFASDYGKLTIFTIGAWAGASHGGILAGLSACGVVTNIVSTAADLMQDFKTGYLTLASPRSMFVSQIIGTAMGCVISPCVFWIFYKAFPDLGLPTSEYPVPFATIYYNIAKLGVEGFSSLPKECLNLCYAFFATSILINLIRDGLGEKRSWCIPVPMAMAIPFHIGPYFAIGMCIGNLTLFVWKKINKTKADAFGQAVASGLICGDGIWTLVASILALAGVKPPICMKFLSRTSNSKVDKFLGS